MYLDGKFNFIMPTILNGSPARAASATAYIYDAEAVRFEFGARSPQMWLWFRAPTTSDDNTTIMVDFVASNAVDLDPDRNEATLDTDILGSSGIIDTVDDGSARLTTSDTIERTFPIQTQRIARRYYGLHVVLGGTNPDLAALVGEAHVVTNPQTNMAYGVAAGPVA